MTKKGAQGPGETGVSEDRKIGESTPVRSRPPTWVDSLPFRVAALLSVAILPLGLISVAQTQRSLNSAQEAFEATLRAHTARIATPEREAIMGAFGLARGLADTISVLRPADGSCRELVGRLRDTNESVSYVGFTEPGAVSNCNSSGERLELSDNPVAMRLLEDRRPEVTFNPAGEVSRQAVIIVSQPVYADDEYLGYVAISVPSRPISVDRPATELGGLGMFLTFNRRGEVLTSEGAREDIADELPVALTLTDMVEMGDLTFQSEARDGTYRTFSVVPIVPGRAYALGSWARGSIPGGPAGLLPTAPLAFPLLMWLVSLGVALMAINRLVLRNVSVLSSDMRSFADKRALPVSDALHDTAPIEFREINRAFAGMARKIVRDEADLENALFERDVLFREVHHRVKNNLQLMSSIINMQIRRSRSEEARSALRGVQERVTSLAAVHRGLYESPEMSEVRIDTLLHELIDQLQVIGIAREGDIEVEVALEPLVLVPDQAGPLALLTTEAVTNALKYIAPDSAGHCWLVVSLRTVGGDGVAGSYYELSISNSINPDGLGEEGTEDHTGLGQRLIDSFVAQLGGRARTEVTHDRYSLVIAFDPVPFESGAAP